MTHPPFALTADPMTASDALDWASELVRGLCGWHVWPVTTETIRVDGSGSHKLLLPSLRVVDVTSVTDNDAPLVVGGDTPDVNWSERGWLTRRSGRFTCRDRGVEVTMRHGYDTALDLAGVVRAVAARARREPGVKAQAAGPMSVEYALDGGLSNLETAAINRYTLPGLA